MNLPTPQVQAPLADPATLRPVTIQISDEQKLELLEHWRSIVKRKWAILGFALVAAVLAAAIAFAMTPIYRSTATVQIESGRSNVVSIEDIYSSTAQAREHYQTQVEILKSREVMLRAVRALKLWDHPDFDPRAADQSLKGRFKAMLGIAPPPVDWTDDTLADAVVLALDKRDMVQIEPVRLSQLARIHVESPDAALAARLANTLAESYIRNDREMRFRTSQEVSGFLQERLGDLRSKLAESERALQAYRESRGIVNIAGSSQTLANQQVSGINERLLAARNRRLELESDVQQVLAVKDGDYSGVPAVMRDAAVADAQRQANDLSRKLAELGQRQGSGSPEVQQTEAQLAKVQATLGSLQAAAVKALTRQYESAKATETSLSRALGSARSGVADINQEEFQLTVLERDVQVNRQLYDMFMSRARETNLAAEVQAAIARVVDPAVPGTLPIKPAKAQLVAVSLVLALLLGGVISLLLDRLDNTVKGGEDAETRLRLPLLTALPDIGEHDQQAMARLFLDEPQSHHAEAIRTARTGVLLSNLDQPHKTVLITSTIPGEGKTTVSINLALAHAQTKRTLLIDADMRRPQVGVRLGLAPGLKGLSNLVAGERPLSECVHTVEGSSLLVVPVGDLPPNPLELILSDRFKAVLNALKERFDIVIIDSPPVELVSEALALAPMAHSTILVVRAMHTPTPLVRKSITRLQRAGASMLGVVLNQLDFAKTHTYYGEYGYGGGSGYGGAGAAAYQPREPRARNSRLPVTDVNT